MYETLNKFVERFEEKHVELILLVLKNVGFVLRKDDPIALKELIVNIRRRANESNAPKEKYVVSFDFIFKIAFKIYI